MKVAEALKRVVTNASKEGRLVTGVTETAAALQRFPISSVMFCVVETKGSEDIQVMLFEAFCTEYKIKLIKVDHCQQLYENNCDTDNITSDRDCDSVKTGKSTCECSRTTDHNGSENVKADDMSPSTCLLLLQPSVMSSEEEFVLAFYETYRYCKHEYPVLRLPDEKSTNP